MVRILTTTLDELFKDRSKGWAKMDPDSYQHHLLMYNHFQKPVNPDIYLKLICSLFIWQDEKETHNRWS